MTTIKIGLKEEQTSDALPGISGSRMMTRRTPKPDMATVHEHGNGRCEEAWIDEDGRRRIRPAQGRIPKYVAGCRACQADDAKRIAAEPTLKDVDLESTVFLVPERPYDQRVIRAYLQQRYPTLVEDMFITSEIRPAKLALHPGAQIIVLNRRALPGKGNPGPTLVHSEDKYGNVSLIEVAPETYIGEITESAPVNVSECVQATPGSMFADAQIDLSELLIHLCDLAAPGFFIHSFKRIVGSDELTFAMRGLT